MTLEAPQGIASRKAAISLLVAILHAQKTVEEARSKSPEYELLEPQDKAFCQQLVMTVLRYKGALDQLLRQYLQKPIKSGQFDIQCCLYIGAAQLLLLNVPNHAAVDTSVELAKTYKAALSGLVNAVLKKVASSEGQERWKKQNIAKLSAPEWLWKGWVKAFGEVNAQGIAEAHLRQPEIDLSLKNPKHAADWAEKLEAIVLPTRTVRTNRSLGRDVTQWPGFEQGEWWVQEAAASLPVKLLGNVKGKYVLDCCAAPGGKTAQLAAAGAQVTAVDQSAQRMKLLDENMTRLGLQVQTEVADLTAWQPGRQFDAVLLDAPCSATGTVRRHPELPWLRTAKDVKRLVQIQQKLLHRAIKWVKPGGVLIYAVCSLQTEEGEQQIDSFVKAGKASRALTLPEGWQGESQWLTAEGDIRTLPTHMAELGGIDGFFIAVLSPIA